MGETLLEADPCVSQKEEIRPSPRGMFSNHSISFMRIGIVGGDRLCHEIIKYRYEHDLSGLGLEVLAVADPKADAPGMETARRCGIPTLDSYLDILNLRNVDTILDLTRNKEVQSELLHRKRANCGYLDAAGARLVMNLIHNLIARRDLERNLADYRQRLHKHNVIVDSLPYRIMIVNSDMTIDTVNQTFLTEYKLTLDDVIGQKCYEVRYGFNKRCSFYGRKCLMEETIVSKKVVSTISEHLDRDGVKTYDVVTVAPIANERGEIVQHLEASRDVTERVRLEREVQQSHIFLQNVFHSTVDGIVVVDTKGRMLLFNEGMEVLTGFSAEEIMAHGHLTSFYNIDVARENMAKMRSDEYGPPGKLNPTSMNILNKHGDKIPVTLSASIVKIDGKEVGSVGVFTDMREIEKMRQDLDQAHLQLVQSEKVASVGRMAAGVAHEINNPLSITMLFAELLEQRLSGDEAAQSDLREIINQTLRCKEIVADLLEFSRKSIGEAVQFDLGWFMDRCLNLLVKLASFHDIEVRKNYPEDLPQMTGDVGQLEQVFTNLFTNAADAMDGEGVLSITVFYDAGKDAFHIEVADTGPGIPKEERDKIFDIFFTTKAVGKGTGLGLSISKNIIELHGGEIRFECPPEGGTVFIIDLPREAMAPSEPDPVFIGMDEL